MKIIRIGRDDSNDIIINDSFVSSKHLVLEVADDGTLRIKDLKSTNGTFVNDFRIRPDIMFRITEKDKVRIGHTPLQLQDYLASGVSDESSPAPDSEPAIDFTPDSGSGFNPVINRDNVKLPTTDLYFEVEREITSAIQAYHQSSDKFDNGYIDRRLDYTLCLDLSIYNSYCSEIFKLLDFVQERVNRLNCQYQDDCQFIDDRRIELLSKRDGTSSIRQSDTLKSEITKCFNQIIENAYDQSVNILSVFYKNRPLLPRSCYETEKYSSDIWETQIKDKSRKRGQPASILHLCDSETEYHIRKDRGLFFQKREYIPFLCEKHLVFKYGKGEKDEVKANVNALVTRLLMAAESGMIDVTVTDFDDLEGLHPSYRKLNKNIYHLVTNQRELMQRLLDMESNMEGIIRNVLTEKRQTLLDVNRNSGIKEPYRILVLSESMSDYPNEIQGVLHRLIRNGSRAGIGIIMMEESCRQDAEADKIINTFLKGSSNVYCVDTVSMQPPLFHAHNSTIIYDRPTDEQMYSIIECVNNGFEVAEEKTVNIADYIPDESEWWTGNSSRFVNIPFGIDAQKGVSSLLISQESGQNSALVIGIPGSGKSVFLHSVIINAALRYSPDELSMYLIDFSGVEFNAYATHNLPHARVVAPEAEREFGLSVLKEIKEEGHRREKLCRDNDVKDIVDLRRKKPDEFIPRILVVIDEFQKLFENRSDYISKYSEGYIHSIIQEYRKFGINLLLATQQLPPSDILPYELIANRVAFKSRPNDFDKLITWPDKNKPLLRTGTCVYNNESGNPSANLYAQGFYVSLMDLENILPRIANFGRKMPVHESSMLVFRGADQPTFSSKRFKGVVSQQSPQEVNIYLGQSIAISTSDVHATFEKSSANNMLIVGGERMVGEMVDLCATMSLMSAHTDGSCLGFIFNYMRRNNELCDFPQQLLGTKPFTQTFFSYDEKETVENLRNVAFLVENRRSEYDVYEDANIYLTFFDFENCRCFDRQTRNKASECATLLSNILMAGPSVGVFTILQTNSRGALGCLDVDENVFNHRVALQMSEKDSNKIIGTDEASKLFVPSRPYTQNRGLYYNHRNNQIVKFIPYKL